MRALGPEPRDGFHDDGFRQNLRQYHRLLPTDINEIQGHSVPAVPLDHAGDLRVPVRPVALEIGDAPVTEQRLHGVGRQRRAFIDETGDAPRGGHVDEDDAVLAEQRVEARLAERLRCAGFGVGNLRRRDIANGIAGDRPDKRHESDERGDQSGADKEPRPAFRSLGEVERPGREADHDEARERS